MREPKSKETNPKVEKRTANKTLRCSICPPNKGCNFKSRSKHGSKTPKYKDKRAKK